MSTIGESMSLLQPQTFAAARREGDGAPEITLGSILVAWLGVLVVILISQVLRLNLGSKLLIASVRAFVQLSLLGLILQPIIDNGSLILVMFLTTCMVMIAALEAVARLTHVYSGITMHAVIAIGVGPILNAVIMLVAVVDPDPLWSPQYAIPLVGMLLGNALTATSLGLGETMSLLAGDGGDNVEFMLARGATLLEACRPVAAAALQKGLVPTINGMNVIGLVTIPGMMTGQLLGGADPVQASRYQITIMYYIVASACFTLLTAILLALHTLTDSEGRLRRDRLKAKPKGKDILIRACSAVKAVAVAAYSKIRGAGDGVAYADVDTPPNYPLT